MKKKEIPTDPVNGTCRKNACPFFQKYERSCPMLVTNTWMEPNGKTKITEDCAPITGMHMQQEMHNRVLAVQKAQEETREQFSELHKKFSLLIAQSHEFMIEQKKPYQRKIK